ncbi:MAG: pyridoxamine 5'-phosphate oxidase family protein [Alphaproteobacteria bacterium]
MAAFFETLTKKHIEFIEKQHMFFVATAPNDGRINLSPKGMDSLKVIDENTIVWLNYTGSGNETAAHIAENGRMTLMFCSFEQKPLILRLYGKAELIYRNHEKWKDYIEFWGETKEMRQFFELKIEMVQTSCGFSVPYYEYQGERGTLMDYWQPKTADEIKTYWQEKNSRSIDGLPTGITDK